jgi:uncharacterized membrane protein YdbT with pleckstrin-like domain
MKKLKERWGIQSNFSLFMILFVFSITGSAAVKLARPILEYVGFNYESIPDHWYSHVLYWFVRIALIFPVYQVLLVCFGWLFGQHQFFWNFEKKMLRRMGLGFLLKD